MSDLLASSIGHSFGASLIPFAILYFALRTPLEINGSKSTLALAFFLAWVWQLIVTIIAANEPLWLPLFAFVSVAAGLLQAKVVRDFLQSAKRISIANWWSLYWRVAVLHLPLSTIIGGLIGFVAQSLGYGEHAYSLGTLAALPASMISIYIAKQTEFNNHQNQESR